MKQERKDRNDGFRLGQIHGKLVPEKAASEAAIQRKLFQGQRLVLVRSVKDKVAIRLFGYEVPLKKATRSWAVDLMGYDKAHNLYVIELKKKDSTEKVEEAVEQLGRYAGAVREILPDLEKEFKAEFFLDIRFKAVKCILLAERAFYSAEKPVSRPSNIEFAYLRCSDVAAFPHGMEPVHIYLRKE